MAPTLYDKKPNPGDLIEIDRGPYRHWALYIGDGYVIHLAPPSEVAGAGANSLLSISHEYAVVRRDRIWDVVGTDSWKINNLLDDEYKVREIHVIIKEARRLVGHRQRYNLRSYNCEHFVTWLRYNKAESRQVRNAEMYVAGGLLAFVGVGVLAGIGALIGSSVQRSPKERNDR
ncbi:phospholipase A and acyltransferase 4-like [Aplochiton taeniatus]